MLDGRIVCRTLVYTAVWEEVGDFYPVLTVRTEAGTAEEQIRVEVVERTPPVISLPVPPEGLQAVAGTELRLEPTYRYDSVRGPLQGSDLSLLLRSTDFPRQ